VRQEHPHPAINGLIPHAYSGDLEGSVRIDGQSTTELKLRDLARTVGTVLQDPAKQIVGATVESELAFGPENSACRGRRSGPDP
jgi:energy-coupling factor transport system ATP-binding protein